MCNNSRVYNVSRRYSMKHKQAVKAVDNCACAWVEFGVSVRDLTLAESVAARNEQAQKREPLPFAELPGLIYRPSEANQAMYREEIVMMRAANQFAQTAA